MFPPRNRQEKRAHRPLQQPLMLEVLEDRTLLSTTPTTVLDLNGLSVNPNKYSSADILVQFQGTPGTPGGPAIVAGTTLGSPLPLEAGFYQVNLSKGMTVEQALSAYKAERGVLTAEPDYDLTVSTVPNDPLLSQQWSLKNSGQSAGKPGADIHAEQAWSVTSGSPKIVVAVMDTGIDYNAPDLYQNIWINQAEIPNQWYTRSSASSGYNKLVYKWQIKTATPGIITFRDLNNSVNRGLVWDNNGDGRIDAGDLLRWYTQGGWMSGSTKDGDTAHKDDLFGWNFVSNSNNPFDDNGHGTHVSGILGGTGNNGLGVAGVDWNVQIMPVKFIGANGDGSVSAFILGLNYEIQHGAKITNNSWEGAPYSQALYNAINNTRLHGQIFVAAAGNEASNDDANPDYPAGFSQSINNVVSVAATDNNDRLASFSNYGAHSVSLAAPGVNILSTLPYGKYGEMSGTSMATPEVTGAMALVWGLHPSWSYTQVINQVLNTTDKLPSLQGKVETGGRLNLAAAVGWNLSTRTTPTITSASVQGPTSTSMNSITLTFNEAIDVSSFSASAVTLTNPYGTRIPVSVRVVSNSGDRQIQLWFATQTTLGNYHLAINSSVHDLMGVAMAPYQSTIALQAPKTYWNSTAATIKPGSLTMSSLTLPASIIGNVTVRLNINYPYDKDLYIYLISPTGKTIALDYNRGGWSANLTNTVFSQQASTPIANGKAPFSGTFIPEASLNQLIGSNANGGWRLAVRNYGTHYGTLVNWSLTVTPAVTVAKTSSISSSPTTSTAKVYSNNTAATIAPKGMAITSVTVPAGTKVGNLQVRLNVKYPYDKDLYIYLITPSGKTIALDYGRGGWSANLTNTVLSQQASTPIAKGKAPFSGTFIPEASLNQLIGSNAGGTWRLAVRNYGTHYGTLVNWSLVLTPAVSTSSVQVSSAEAAAPVAAASSPSTVVSSPTTAAVEAPPVPVPAGDANAAPPVPAIASGTNEAQSWPFSLIDQILSSTRAWTQLVTGLLASQRSLQNSIGATNE